MGLHSWIFDLQESGKLPHTLSFTDVVQGNVQLPEAVLAMKPSDVDLLGARESCRSTKRASSHSQAGLQPIPMVSFIKIVDLNSFCRQLLIVWISLVFSTPVKIKKRRLD